MVEWVNLVSEMNATAARSRYLDVLRGVAVLGILPVNLPFMAMAVENATTPAPGTGWAEGAAVAGTRVLFEYKFVTLFSLLFGAGLVILRERSASGALTRRLLVLWAFGALHATLLFWGDILSTYAPIGLAVFWAWRWRPRTLAWTGAALAAVPLTLMIVALPLLWALRDQEWLRHIFAAEPPAPPAPPVRSWSEFWTGLENWGPSYQEAVFASGTYLHAVVLRAILWFLAALFLIPYWGWRIAGVFMVGMALAKSGWFLRPQEHPGPFRRLAIGGLAVGLPLELAGALPGHGGPVAALSGEILHYLGSIALAGGYAGLVGLLLPRLPRAVELLGRAAFTNYIGQSFVAMLLFTGVGFGLYGKMSHIDLWGFVLALWALNLLASTLWLSRFSHGPLEGVWRWAYGGLPRVSGVGRLASGRGARQPTAPEA